MAEHEGYIWIQDAAKEYKRSRGWLDEQVRHGVLTYVRFEGDKHTYLVRTELDKLLGKPSIQEKRSQDQAG